MSQYIRLRRSFVRRDRLNVKQLDAIERSLYQAGIPIKIEAVADGIIIFHKATTAYATNLRAILTSFVTFVNGTPLPSSYVEIFNSMTNETLYIEANNDQYMEMCANVIRMLAKDMKEAENPLAQHE